MVTTVQGTHGGLSWKIKLQISQAFQLEGIHLLAFIENQEALIENVFSFIIMLLCDAW